MVEHAVGEAFRGLGVSTSERPSSSANFLPLQHHRGFSDRLMGNDLGEHASSLLITIVQSIGVNSSVRVRFVRRSSWGAIRNQGSVGSWP